jgi:hypothetical protein
VRFADDPGLADAGGVEAVGQPVPQWARSSIGAERGNKRGEIIVTAWAQLRKQSAHKNRGFDLILISATAANQGAFVALAQVGPGHGDLVDARNRVDQVFDVGDRAKEQLTVSATRLPQVSDEAVESDVVAMGYIASLREERGSQSADGVAPRSGGRDRWCAVDGAVMRHASFSPARLVGVLAAKMRSVIGTGGAARANPQGVNV